MLFKDCTQTGLRPKFWPCNGLPLGLSESLNFLNSLRSTALTRSLISKSRGSIQCVEPQLNLQVDSPTYPQIFKEWASAFSTITGLTWKLHQSPCCSKYLMRFIMPFKVKARLQCIAMREQAVLLLLYAHGFYTTQGCEPLK